MISRAQARQQRRWHLQQQSADLRQRLTQHAHALEPVWVWAERTRAGAMWLRRHPWVALGVGVGLLWRRPREVLRWGTRVWGVWQTLQRAKGTLGGLQRWWQRR
jgi:hypothetical protein